MGSRAKKARQAAGSSPAEGVKLSRLQQGQRGNIRHIAASEKEGGSSSDDEGATAMYEDFFGARQRRGELAPHRLCFLLWTDLLVLNI